MRKTMLESLYVKNLALIDKTEVCFTPGLNILSGETGAGKSIIIGSVMIALGAKVPRDMIRNHEKEAYIELVFTVHGSHAKKKLEEMDIYPEDGQLIISRRITESRSICKINGETVTASKVREAAAVLLDIHGQHEHQKLLSAASQLEFVDRFGQDAGIPKLRREIADCYRNYMDCRQALEKSRVDEAVRIRTVDILQYEINEIEQAEIDPGEEARLEQEWKTLQGQEKIRQGLLQLEEYLSVQDGGAQDLIERSLVSSGELTEYGSEFKELHNQLMDAESILSDCSHAVSRLLENQEADPDRSTQVEERLDEIRHLMQKYSCDEAGLLALAKSKEKELDEYLHLEETQARLEKETEAAHRKLEKAADELSRLRRSCADQLSEKLIYAMIDLNFLDVRFRIDMNDSGTIGANGRDSIQFMIAVNPGEEPKPLAMVASGGELSRIMLAMKSVLAEREETETLIFDEIDAGISGRTAQKVAARLCVTAKSCQVICISHLPQIVSMADTHFLIEKDAQNQVTTTHIRKLNSEESVTELARLLGGTQITDRVLENAREMKDMAERAKEYKITNEETPHTNSVNLI